LLVDCFLNLQTANENSVFPVEGPVQKNGAIFELSTILKV
jgi:hypothetical protein